MIKIENIQIFGIEPAIRGMRNPMNSWDKSDSGYHETETGLLTYTVGQNDIELAVKLAGEGSPNRKFLRMICVWLDITAPLYWWKQFDTYKVGTVADSCSTMHKLHSKRFTSDDFSAEHLDQYGKSCLAEIIQELNVARDKYIRTKEKTHWWQLIQLLPTSYNQKRTVMLNYEVLVQMYKWRKDHKLDEWHEFCRMIETLPGFEMISAASGVKDENVQTEHV